MEKNVLSSLKINRFDQKNLPTISHGKGIYLFDINGNQYIDAVSGTAAVSNLGHGDERIGEIISTQLSKVGNHPTFRFQSEILESYCGSLLKFAPPGFSKVWLVTSGTEAIENAVKVAIQYFSLKGKKSKYKIVTRKQCYHGNSLFTLGIGGVGPRKEVYSKLLPERYTIPTPYDYRSDMDKDSFMLDCANKLEELIIKEGQDTVAAVLLEPIIGASMGAVVPTKSYYKRIREICNRYDVLLIGDEVMTGFGRTGEFFGFNHFDVVPDIIAVGKGMSGGYYPLSGILVRESVADLFSSTQSEFVATYTYACNQLGSLIGDYVLSRIHSESLSENARITGEYLKSRIEKLKKYPIVGDVRGIGLMIAIEFVVNQNSKLPFERELNITSLVSNLAFEDGLIVYEGSGTYDGIKGDHILLTPPLIVTLEEIDLIYNILDKIINKLSSQLIFRTSKQ